MIGELTNHLWQSTLFAIAAGILTLAFRSNRAKVRYWLWLGASLKFFIPFALLIGVGSHIGWAPTAQKLATQVAGPAIQFTVEQISEPFALGAASTPSTTGHFDWFAAGLFAVWVCGFLGIAMMRSRVWLRIQDRVRASTPPEGRLPIGRRLTICPTRPQVEVRLSRGLVEPGVVGVFHPILLLPEGIVERLTPSQMEAVLAHELCHIRRRDNLWASLHMMVEAVFWFHPLVWWIGARLVEERERACDEEVLSLGNKASVYADAILHVCKLYLESPLACVSGVAGADIRRRIEAIMSNRGVQGLNRAKKLLLVAAGMAALLSPVLIGIVTGLAQSTAQQAPTASTPKFDVASIKPCQPGDGPGRGGNGDMGANGGVDSSMPEGIGGYFRASPGRLDVTCGSILTMVNFTYVGHGTPLLNNPGGPMREAESIQGVPKWALAARYTIHAETDDPVANGPTQRAPRELGAPLPAAMLLYGPMLQHLLEDRFHLKIRRVTEEGPMYGLTVAKGGFKLKPMQDGDCLPDGPPEWPAGGKPACNWTGWDVHGPNRRLLFGGIPMNRITQNLAELILDRNVINRTGITGKFVARLEYAPDENTRCIIRCVPLPSNTDIPPAATIFTALEQQFGLKLEPIKGPREHIVIDSVERPSEN